MFLFGHIGITVGFIYILTSESYILKKTSKLHTSMLENIDYRIIIAASVLPDIIDKFIGMVLFKDELGNGRLFSHSMIIIGIISISVFIMFRKNLINRVKAICFAAPIWIHLFLDKMWEDPYTLFWPLHGYGFPRLGIVFSDYFQMLLTDPYILVGEIIGISIIIALFVWHRLFIRNRFYGFLKDGRLKRYEDTPQVINGNT